MRELNFESDNQIDVANLQDEFRVFPSMLFAYLEAKADAESNYELSKAKYEEHRAAKYLEFKNSGEKITEAGVQAMIDTEASVKDLMFEAFSSKRDLETLKNYVESLRAKKDMLVQLGADARKE